MKRVFKTNKRTKWNKIDLLDFSWLVSKLSFPPCAFICLCISGFLYCEFLILGIWWGRRLNRWGLDTNKRVCCLKTIGDILLPFSSEVLTTCILYDFYRKDRTIVYERAGIISILNFLWGLNFKIWQHTPTHGNILKCPRRRKTWRTMVPG